MFAWINILGGVCMSKYVKISMLFIGIFSVLFTWNLYHVNAASKGSTIGPVDVSGMSKKEMVSEVKKAVENWQNEEIAIQNGAEEITVAGKVFTFDVQRSVEQLRQIEKKPWYDFWSKKPTGHVELIVNSTTKLENEVSKLVEDIQPEKIDELLKQAANLPTRPLKLVVKDFKLTQGKQLSAATVTVKQPINKQLRLLVTKLNGQILQPRQQWSFFDNIGKDYTVENSSIIATAIYNNAVKSDFDIVEQHQATKVQSYSKAGFEVVVDAGKDFDFEFVSTHDGIVKIVAMIKKNKLLMQFYVQKGDSVPKIQLYTNNEQPIKARSIYRYSNRLAIGDSKILQRPKDGLEISLYKKKTSKVEGTKHLLVRASYYPPIHKIILKSLKETEMNNSENLPDENPLVKSENTTTLEKKQSTKNKLIIIKKIERPTKKELKDENVIYSEADDSYYYVHAPDLKKKGEK